MKKKKTVSDSDLQIIQEMNEFYPESQLEALYTEYLRGQVLIHASTDQLKDYVHLAQKKYIPTQQELVQIFLAILGQPELLTAMLADMPADVYSTIVSCIWEGPRALADLHITATEIVNSTSGAPQAAYALFCIQQYAHNISNRTRYSHGSRLKNMWIFIPPAIAAVLRTVIAAPEPEQPDAFQTVPGPGSDLYYYENKGITAAALQDLSARIITDNAHLTFIPGDGMLMRRSAQALIRMFSLPEFYPGAKDLDILAFEYLSWFLCTLHKNHEFRLPASPYDALRQCFQLLISGDMPVNQAFVPYVRDFGHRPEWKRIVQALPALLALCPHGQWVSFEQTVHRALMHGNLPLYYSVTPDPEEEYYIDLGALDRPAIDPLIVREAITIPFVRNCIAVLATLGIVDLVLEKPHNPHYQYNSKKYLTPADGIRYIRITELGEFLLGRRTEMPVLAPGADQEPFLLDASRLLITVRGNAQHRLSTAAIFGRRIGGNIFITDAAVFLKGCRSHNDVLRKIELFRNSIRQQLPANWQEFFTDLLSRTNPMIHESAELVFRLREPGMLASLFAQDSVLRSLVRRGEGLRIIISRQDLPRLRTRLEELGYLMEF